MNPVLVPDRPWEKGRAGRARDGVQRRRLVRPQGPDFQDVVHGRARDAPVPTSKDGIAWGKPELDVKKGTNIVQTGPPRLQHRLARPGGEGPGEAVQDVPLRQRREQKSVGLVGSTFSADGIHWSDRLMPTGSCGDRSTVFYNPFRKVWVYSLRHGWGQPAPAPLLGDARPGRRARSGQRSRAAGCGSVPTRSTRRGHDLQGRRRSYTTSTASPTRA